MSGVGGLFVDLGLASPLQCLQHIARTTVGMSNVHSGVSSSQGQGLNSTCKKFIKGQYATAQVKAV